MINYSIILFGYMGVGKSYIGRKLSKEFMIDFFDLSNIAIFKERQIDSQSKQQSTQDTFSFTHFKAHVSQYIIHSFNTDSIYYCKIFYYLFNYLLFNLFQYSYRFKLIFWKRFTII